MSKLIIIRGNSGSVKTTIAKALQHKLGYNVMLISQDIVRREILRVKDGMNNLALPLIEQLLVYGHKNCEFVIVEGILKSKWYMPLFELAKAIYANNIYAYYYDLSFKETLLRHNTKANKDDFGEREMKEWWNEKDYINIIPEKLITADMSLFDTISMICNDVK